MCGIVGYVGPRPVLPILIGGLEKLEYRGYDSSGIATVTAGNGEFEIHRAQGKLSKLKEILTENGKLGRGATGVLNVGIGHTRWATHGRPSETNAHPHAAGKVCVVHNGIIENYLELREKLSKEGCKFASDTDTEIAAHLIDVKLRSNQGLPAAVRAALAEIRGSYALVVISTADPDKIVVARNSSPVIIGLGEGENFVASDIPAIMEHTRKVVVLEDGDFAVLTADGVKIEHNGVEIKREPFVVTWDPITAEKGGFRHFMLKEIHEQPQVVTETFRGRVDPGKGTIHLDGMTLTDEELKEINRVCIVGCGTAWHAGLITRYFIERLANVQVDVEYGSEFRYRTPILDKKTLFVVISQSGETADTLGSLNLAAECGARTLAICNVVGSTMTRKAESVIYTHAGPEISVASTKAFVTQLTAGMLLALKLGAVKGRLTTEQLKEHIDSLVHLPAQIEKSFECDAQVEKIVKHYGSTDHDFLFLGRGLLYPIALEGALKMKELSYIHAEGYPAGEMKHGPIALISEDTPVVAVIGHDGVNYEKTLSNLMEVAARGGKIIAVTDKDTPELKNIAWETIVVGSAPPLMLPMVLTPPLQLLSYHMAVYRGTDVDQPRNLAKSVTVE